MKAVKPQKKKKGNGTTILLIAIFLIGLSLILYPSVSNWWNSFHQTRAINTYTDTVANMDNAEYEVILHEAQEYNKSLAEHPLPYELNDDQMETYLSTLDITGTGIMGYIDIPSINVSLPIYHTASESVLQVAAGHLEWTSLPVGGKTSHCVLSGHRGLPSAKLFTNLDELVEGDTFTITVLDEVFTYEVDQIKIVLPAEIEQLEMVKGKDYVTLVTCTPYGINTHRLLVRAHRIENLYDASSVRITADAVVMLPALVALFIFIPSAVLAMIILIIISSRKRTRSLEKDLTDLNKR